MTRAGADDLRRLFNALERKASEAADQQIANLQRQPGQTDEQFGQFKDYVRSLLRLVVRVQAGSGEWTAATTSEALNEDSLPVSIRSVQYESSFLFRGQFKSEPQNSFAVTLDFTRTSILDLTNLSAGPSLNQSGVLISGGNVTWVNGLSEELRTFFEARATARGWLYSAYAYDVLLIIIGFPLSFNLVYHIDRFVRPVLRLPDALFVALYVYFVLVALLGFRLLFNYAKWVLPKIEGPSRRHEGPKLHKTILGAIALALAIRAVTSLLWILGIHLH